MKFFMIRIVFYRSKHVAVSLFIALITQFFVLNLL